MNNDNLAASNSESQPYGKHKMHFHQPYIKIFIVFQLSFLALSGYVVNVNDEVVSASNKNTYFDIDVKYSPTCRSKVRVMSDDTHSHNKFLQLQSDAVPIKMSQLSPIKTGKQFFNPSLVQN